MRAKSPVLGAIHLFLETNGLLPAPAAHSSTINIVLVLKYQDSSGISIAVPEPIENDQQSILNDSCYLHVLRPHEQRVLPLRSLVTESGDLFHAPPVAIQQFAPQNVLYACLNLRNQQFFLAKNAFLIKCEGSPGNPQGVQVGFKVFGHKKVGLETD